MSNFKLSSIVKGRLYEEAAPLALKARESLKLGYDPIGDMYELLESKGFLILSFPSIDNKLSGFHTKKSDTHCIYINSGHVLGRQHFSLAHEFYHSLYDSDKYTICYGNDESEGDFQSKEEAENEYRADCFAAQFLMTEKEMIRFVKKNSINHDSPNIYDIIRVQHHFSVSYEAALKRFCRIFKINYYFQKTLAQFSNLDYKNDLERATLKLDLKTNLINPTPARIPENFFKDISHNLAMGRISDEKAAELELLVKGVLS